MPEPRITLPLTHIQGLRESRVDIETHPTGWYLRTPSGLRADLVGYADGVVCRIRDGERSEVVQLGIGNASSRLCNAVFSPAQDTAILLKGDELALEKLDNGTITVSCAGPLVVQVLTDYLKEHCHLPWYQPLNRTVFTKPPAGWCSWYYFYTNITEDEVVKNTDWLAEHLQRFGCEWIQIDDGWQGRGSGYGSNRDWFTTSRNDFPRGMRWIADYIRARGFRPGIWCIPFTESNPQLFLEEPGLCVRDARGLSPLELSAPSDYSWMGMTVDRWFEWDGRYLIDFTSPQGQEFLTRLFTMLCDEWGYDYVKIDGQSRMAGFFAKSRPLLADPSLDSERVSRLGLQRMKQIMGPEKFLLNCIGGYESGGFCEGMRIGGDVTAGDWSGMEVALCSTLEKLFLNTNAFYTDPDALCVRAPLPLEHARFWTTWVGITGQLLMLSDNMYELPEERVELLRRILPVADIHPMELYPLDARERPRIYDLKVDKPGVGRWDVLAVVNWHATEPAAITLSPATLGLAPGNYVIMDFWNGELLHTGDGCDTVQLPPQSSTVLSYWADAGRPCFCGTNRHITQGAIDVESLAWDEERLTLSGVSLVVGGDPYLIRIYVPGNYRVVSEQVTHHGKIAELTLCEAENTTVAWEMRFAR